MKEFRADLHCHSTCSDGSMDPKDLIAHAKKIGLSGISITDHDSVLAYKTAIPAALEAGIWIGSGVEFSSMDGGLGVHVLGYDIDLDHPSIQAFCQRHLDRRWDRNLRILEKLKKKGIVLESDPLEKQFRQGQPIGRPHIALALVEKGYVRTIEEAFHTLIGDEKPCFDAGVAITTDETIEVIHQAGGKAFIAHPHLMKKEKEVLKLLEKPFDGIECFYSKCLPHQEQKWVSIANKRGLLISGGSDFHGEVRPNIPLGCSWVDQQTFASIFKNHLWK